MILSTKVSLPGAPVPLGRKRIEVFQAIYGAKFGIKNKRAWRRRPCVVATAVHEQHNLVKVRRVIEPVSIAPTWYVANELVHARIRNKQGRPAVRFYAVPS